MKTKKYKPSDLSEVIFWDVEVSELEWDAHKAFILERVMSYGNLPDWGIVKRIYGFKQLKEIALNLRNLDDFSLAFLSTIFQIEKSNFRCYKLKQSSPNFWNY